MKLMQKITLTSLFLVGIISNANAATVTYDYVGSAFNNFKTINPLTGFISDSNSLPPNIGSRITGSATFANGIDNSITSFTLSDGINTLDNTMTGIRLFNMTFNNSNVDTWSIGLAKTVNSVSVSLFTMFDGNLNVEDQATLQSSTIFGLIADDFANIHGSPGTWTQREDQVSAVPVPAALPLMASALGLFGFGAMRRKTSKT